MVSQEGHSAQLLKVKRDEAPAGGSSREQAHGGLRDADTTKRLLKVPRLGRGGEGRGRDGAGKDGEQWCGGCVGGAASLWLWRSLRSWCVSWSVEGCGGVYDTAVR
jgi:hypothetical protein